MGVHNGRTSIGCRLRPIARQAAQPPTSLIIGIVQAVNLTLDKFNGRNICNDQLALLRTGFDHQRAAPEEAIEQRFTK